MNGAERHDAAPGSKVTKAGVVGRYNKGRRDAAGGKDWRWFFRTKKNPGGGRGVTSFCCANQQCINTNQVIRK
jgi:hypothetical protein